MSEYKYIWNNRVDFDTRRIRRRLFVFSLLRYLFVVLYYSKTHYAFYLSVL